MQQFCGQQAYALSYQSLTYDVNGLALGTGATSAKDAKQQQVIYQVFNGMDSIAIGTKASVGKATSYKEISSIPKFHAYNNAIAIGNQSNV